MTVASGVTPRPAGGRPIQDQIGFWLLLHVAAWTLYATLSNMPADIHHDMAEAYAWGREFQLGYYKHPPFWAWITGLWFSVLPRAGWAFYLLSMVNAACGLWAVWLIAGRYLEDSSRRLAAVLLLELTPFYHFLGFKYNANTIFLSLWPWATYFFLRVVEDRSMRAAVGLGLAAGFGLLSKYYFGVLLAAFGIATLADPRRRDILRSPAPWLAVAVMLAVIAPHVFWLTRNSYGPFAYVSDTAQHARGYILWKAAQFGLGCVLFHVAVVAFLGVFSDGSWRRLLRFMSWRESSAPRRLLLVVAMSPPLLTMLIALISNIKIDTNFAIGVFPIIPLLLLTCPGFRLDPSGLVWLRRSVLALMGLSLIAAPAIGYARFAMRAEKADEPRKEAARKAETLYREAFGAPLRIVAGSWPYADETPFYARGEVSQFIDFSMARSPWITDDRLRREGAAALCLATDGRCQADARAALPEPLIETSFTARKRFLGREGRPYDFILLMQPPRPS
ncbi:MAG: glycosyltransferase family 39 protein [Rhizobiales bacterium]|nr:glycosyltransferase family 39 protein [Hyphomicrobiales bacterium]